MNLATGIIIGLEAVGIVMLGGILVVGYKAYKEMKAKLEEAQRKAEAAKREIKKFAAALQDI